MLIVLVASLWLAAPAVRGTTADTSTVGDGLPAEVGREDLLRLIRARSPALATIAAEVDVVRAEEVQARLWPNPELRYLGYGRLFGTAQAINGQQHQAEIGMPLLLAGQARTRTRAARARTRAMQTEVCLVGQGLAALAVERFQALLAGQERLAVLEDGARALATAEELTRVRASLGAQTQYDVLRVAAERETFAVELSDARADVVDAAADLAAVLGAPRWRPRAVGSLEDAARADSSAAARGRLDASSLPTVVSARRWQDAAVAERRAADRERWPVPSVSLGTYFTTDGTSGSVLGGLTLPLPVFDRAQGLRARARAVERAADARRTQIERAARSEIHRALDVLHIRRDSLQSFRHSALARAPELRTMAHEAYRGGTSSVLELLDAERAWLDVQLRWIDLLERAARARLELDLASGALARGACQDSP